PLGPRVNSKNIHGLASATGGAVNRLLATDKPADLATRIRTSLAVPVLYPTQTTFSPEVIDVLPAQLPPLRGDCPTLAVGQMKPAEKIECRVEGMVAGQKIQTTITHSVPTPELQNFFLVHIAQQWRTGDKSAPAMIRADRSLAL